MRLTSPPISSRKKLAACAVFLCVIAISAVVARPWLNPASPAPTTSSASTASSETGASGAQPEEVETITLTPFGFEPREMTRPPGPFVIAVHNQSNSPDVSLRLSRVQGESLREVRLSPGKRRWEQRLALGAGEYILSEANRPEWTCRINVGAR